MPLLWSFCGTHAKHIWYIARCQYDTFYGSRKQNLSNVSLNLIEIGNEVSRDVKARASVRV